MLSVPLRDREHKNIGVFQALNSLQGGFDKHDIDLAILLCDYISSSLENSLLTNKIIESKTKLIYKLSVAAEFKDEDTSLHTKRVSYYSAIIGRAYGLSDEDVEMLMLLAPMHDIGKIGISDALLHKPEKLSDEEFEEIRKHTLIGYNLLYDEDDEILQQAALIARDHHERWDGNGYPGGVSGEDISINGRIVAIADVFDALTSKRAYKKAWEMDDAFQLLKENSGTHFDPKLVELFLANLDKVEQVYWSYHD
ncbi:MAG TPA: HD-GYP domain-containing protein [Methylophaga sp.]|nr:HD-GYP domain-containing protein [Methylophaga sp.]